MTAPGNILWHFSSNTTNERLSVSSVVKTKAYITSAFDISWNKENYNPAKVRLWWHASHSHCLNLYKTLLFSWHITILNVISTVAIHVITSWTSGKVPEIASWSSRATFIVPEIEKKLKKNVFMPSFVIINQLVYRHIWLNTHNTLGCRLLQR